MDRVRPLHSHPPLHGQGDEAAAGMGGGSGLKRVWLARLWREGDSFLE